MVGRDPKYELPFLSRSECHLQGCPILGPSILLVKRSLASSQFNPHPLGSKHASKTSFGASGIETGPTLGMFGAPGYVIQEARHRGKDVGRFLIDLQGSPGVHLLGQCSVDQGAQTDAGHLDPESMYNHGPKPRQITQKAAVLHVFVVQVSFSTEVLILILA